MHIVSIDHAIANALDASKDDHLLEEEIKRHGEDCEEVGTCNLCGMLMRMSQKTGINC